MNTTQTHQLLKEQQQALTRLLALLKLECDALCEKNSEAIVVHAAQKQQLIDQVETLFQQYSAQNNPALSPQEGQAGKLWQEVKTLAEQCRQQNQVNGNIIISGNQFARRALTLLRGEATQENTCYSRDGKTDSSLTPRTLAKA